MRCSVLAICDIATHDAGGWRMNGLSRTRWIKAFRFMSNQPRQAPREALAIQYKTIQEMAATGTSIHRSTDLMKTIAPMRVRLTGSLTRRFKGLLGEGCCR